MLYRLIIGLLAGQASGLMFAPMVSTPGLRTAVSPVMQYGGYQQQGGGYGGQQGYGNNGYGNNGYGNNGYGNNGFGNNGYNQGGQYGMVVGTNGYGQQQGQYGQYAQSRY